ncbi:hypothetical protein BZL30_8264 [Mycobacterium kansasii]|uniref:Uncharacterized protein n=1 Tax=Mycobacterium kansasii TaxID=1768 RepID=A0A1V3WHW2_MYCKA|nr:hypothetical protein BZL30_8264 [Mycobacterium kansasii]
MRHGAEDPNPPALVTAATTSRQWLNAQMGNSTPSISATLVRIWETLLSY